MKHDGKFYNFICSADHNQWERDPSVFPASRVFEYTESYIVDLAKSSGNVTDFLLQFPTIFAYEDQCEKSARLGRVTQVKLVDGSFVLNVEFDDNYLPLSNLDLNELQFELGLNSYEFSRTHWAVKHVDIEKVLATRGKRVIQENSALNLMNPNIPFNAPLAPTVPTTVDQSAAASREKEKHRVFISYAHADKEVLNRLMIHLTPLKALVDILIWTDEKIKPGEDWKKEIEKNLSSCSIAILIFSADFLASEFISTHEIPPLLSKVESDGCKVVPLIAKPCLFSELPMFSKYQAINDPKTALSSVGFSQQEEILVRTARQVLDFAK